MENKYRVIGIAGKKFSGKDTLGHFFVQKYGYEQIAYADPLKEIGKIFGFTDEQLYGSKKEELDEFWQVTPRKFLQFVGTDMFRDHSDKISPNMGINTWTNIVKKRIQENPNKYFVITDVRFPNEAELIKELGGTIIKLKRNNDSNDEHASESLIESLPADFEFENNGTKEQLYSNVLTSLGLPLFFTFPKYVSASKKRRESTIKPQEYHECDFDYEKEKLINSIGATPESKSLSVNSNKEKESDTQQKMTNSSSELNFIQK
jgi:hypothetical protein